MSMDAGPTASGGEMRVKAAADRHIRSHPADCAANHQGEMGRDIFCNRELNMKQVSARISAQHRSIESELLGSIRRISALNSLQLRDSGRKSDVSPGSGS